MRFIIDGYNLAHASTWLGLKGQVREPLGLGPMLIHMLADYAERSDDRMTVVFDGVSPERGRVSEIGRRAGIDVVFSGPEVNADTLIEKMLEVSTGARETTVVSSDREVRAAASRCNAKSCTAEEFFNRIRGVLAEPAPERPTEPPEKFGGLTDSDTTVWMRIFGFDEDEKTQ